MNTTTRSGTAERLGRWLGRGWRAYARGERRVSGRLVSWGLPPGGAVSLLWAVKIVVLGVLLYSAFWLALVVVFAVAGAWVAATAVHEEALEPEWRNGPAGFGLYTYDGYRIDPHVEDDD